MTMLDRTGPQSPAADHRQRVILVGRTGLDQLLRRDPGLSLIRARTALDAIGELGDLQDAAAGAVVVVAAELSKGDAAAELVAALRRVEPTVRVAAVGVVGQPVGEFDSIVAGEATGDDLRQIRQRTAKPATPNPTPKPEAKPKPITEPDPTPKPEPHATAPTNPAPTGDGPMVEALLQGRDLIEPAIALIRDRLARPTIRFEPGDDSQSIGCPVAAPGKVFGRLIDDATTDARDLASTASWMAAWLKLGDQQRELRRAAFTDPLTGAWNRRYFDRFLASAIDRARAGRQSLTVMVFDIDDFKGYNDRHGHAAGDDILIEAVRLLNSGIRPTDRVCRIGGDEFAVIFYEPDGPRTPNSKPPDSIYAIATRFRKQLSSHRFPKLTDEAPARLGISGGLATYPWDGADPAALLARADELALQSKAQGKNCLTFGPGAERSCGSDDPIDLVE